MHRALVVSYEAFHCSGLATVCPDSARPAKYPGEVTIPRGHACQTEDAVILCHQVRTIDLAHVSAFDVGGAPRYVTTPERRRVREALSHHLDLDVPLALDGAV